MSVILNVAFVGLSILRFSIFAITQFSDHVKIRFISQLINGWSSILKKFLKCFNDTTISTSFFMLLRSIFLVILVL